MGQLSDQSLSEVLARHLDGPLSLGEFERRIARKHGDIGWNIARATLSRLRSGRPRTTDWQKLLAIAWALDLDREATNEILHAAGKQADLAYFYRISEEGDASLFEQWPELKAADESGAAVSDAAVSSAVDMVEEAGEAVAVSEVGTPFVSGEGKRRLLSVVLVIAGLALVAALAVTLQGGGSVSTEPADAAAADQADDAASSSVEGDQADPGDVAVASLAGPVSPEEPSSATATENGSSETAQQESEREDPRPQNAPGESETSGSATFIIDRVPTWSGVVSATGELLNEVFQVKSWVRQVLFHLDGAQVATAAADSFARIYDGDNLRRLEHPDQLHGLAYSPDGSVLVAVGTDQTIVVWDPVSKQRITEPVAAHRDEIAAVAFRPDGRQLATVGRDGQLYLFATDTERSASDSLTADRSSNP